MRCAISAGSRTLAGISRRLNDGAAASIVRRYAVQVGLAGSKTTAIPSTLGAQSLSSCSHFPPHYVNAIPILLPCQNGCRISIGRRLRDGAFNNVARHSRDLCTVSLLPFAVECTMNLGPRALIPTAVSENRGQVPRLFDFRQAEIDFRLDLSAQHF